MRPVTRRAGNARPILLVAAAGACFLSGGALAMDSCAGEFSSTALRALPAPAVIGLDLSTSTPTDPALSDAFTRGMRESGAKVAGPRPATVTLRLSYSILGQGGSGAQPGGSGGGSGAFQGNSQTFLQGGINRANPGMPTYDAFHPAQPAQSGLLIMRAEARSAASGTIDWIGSVQCTMQGSDNRKLAYDLGRLIGGSVGQRRSRVAM